MKARRYLLLLPLLSSLGLLSCSYRPQGATGVPADDLREQAAGPMFADPSLDGDLEVGPVQALRLETGKLRLTIPLQNVSGDYLKIMIKVTFKDENGDVIYGDETPYEFKDLPVGTTNHVVTSLREKASRYHIQIRRYES